MDTWVRMIFGDFFVSWWVFTSPPRVVVCQKIFAPRPPWAGLAQFQVGGHFYVVKLECAPASPQGPWGPKLWGIFIYPQTIPRYHPTTFGFGPTLGLGTWKWPKNGSSSKLNYTNFSNFVFLHTLGIFQTYLGCQNKKIKKRRLGRFWALRALKVGRFWG